MKHLKDFLRQDVGKTLAMTVGSPSAHRRNSRLKHLAFMLLFLLGGIGNVWGDNCTLTSAQIKAGSGSTSYGSCSATDGCSKTWNAYAIKNKHSNSTSDYEFWQIKKYASNTAYYVQVPQMEGQITSLTITVSSSNKSRTDGSNSATLYFSSSNSTSDAGTGVASGTGTSSVTINCSSLNLTSGYITASGAVRIWDVEVTYSTGGGTPQPTVSTTPSTSWNFGEVAKSAEASKDITITGSNLTSDLSFVVTGGYTLSASSATPSEGAVNTTLTVSKNKNTTGANNGTLTISGGGLENDVTVALTMTIVDDPEPTGTFALFEGDLEEGDYLITHASENALQCVINSDRFGAQEISVTNDEISNPDASLVWHIAPAETEGYWTIYNQAASKYAASTGAKNKGALLDSDDDDKALWSFNSSYDFVNKQNTASSVNATLRYNSQNALNTSWACYASGTGSAPVLYKKQVEGQPKAPTFSIPGGNYETAQSVGLSCETEDVTIHYTLDGTTPTNASPVYSTALAISSTTTIKAIAIKNEKSSNIVSATYTIIIWQTVADVWDGITAEGPLNAHIYGYVSQTNVSGYANNFYISDNGSTEGNQLYAYRMDMNSFTVAVGDKVKLAGDLTILNEVKEFKYTNAENCGKVIALEAKGALQSVAVSGTPTKTEYAANEDFDPAGLKVMGTYANGFVGEITEGITWGNDLTDGKVTNSTTVHVTATVSEVASQAYNVAVTVAAKTLLSIAATPASYTIYTGEALPEPVIMATYSEGEPADVSKEATYDSENVFNTETIDNPDPQTITASYTFGGVTKTTTYTVSVKDYANDVDHPYTPEQARYITINAVGSTKATKDIYVQGIVSRANAVTGTNKRQRYWISVDGETTSTEFEVYNGKYLAGGDFSTANQLVAGDEVIVKGKVIYYQSTTPEFATGESQLESLLRTPNFAITDVTALEVGATDLAVTDLTYNADGEGAVTFASSDNTDAVTIVDGKLHAVAVGTATITANLAADGIYKAATTEFDVTVIAAQTRYAVTFDMNGGSADPEMSLGDQLENANVIIPAGTFTKDGYKFNGWTVVAGETLVDVTKTGEVYSFEMPAAAVTVTAQWVEGSDFEWVAANKGYINQQDISTATAEANPISIVFAKESAQNGPKYYDSGTSVRTYAGNTITIATKSDTKLIKKITFTYNSTNTNVVADGLSQDKLTWTGLAKTVVLTTDGGQAHFKTITVTYINGMVTTLDIADVSMKLSEETQNLSIDCNVNPTPAISYEIATADQAIATIENGVVTAQSVGGPINVTARIAQGSNYTAAVANFTITVTEKTQPTMSFPQASYNANLGSDFEEPELTTNPGGIGVTYSSSVPGVATVVEATGVITLVGEGETVITAAFAGNDDYSANSASYTLNVIDPNKDVLTAALIGKTSYANWNDMTFGSGVKYAGNSTTGSSDNAGNIQLRVSSTDQDKSGIVTTSKIGYLKSISATRGTNQAGHYAEIYAKSSAYESAADLYDSDKRGTLIGTLPENGDCELSFEENSQYRYIGIKSKTGAVYYADITITWEPDVFPSYTVTYQAGEVSSDPIEESIEEGTNISLKENPFTAPEGKMFNGWKMEGEENAREAGSKYTVTEAVTFVAQWISVYTITYKAGDGNGEDVEVNNIPAGDYELAGKPEGFSRDNYDFVGWKLNNTGDLLEVGDTYSVSGNAEFTAQWSYVKQNAELSYTTTSYNIIKGQTFDAPTVNNPNSLTVTYSGDNNEIAIVDAETGALILQGGIGTITVTASSAMTEQYYAGSATYTLTIKDNKLAGNWRRINANEDLQVGMKVIIAQYVSSGNNIYTMGAQGSNNRPAVESSLSENVLIPNASTEIFTLVDAGNGHYALKAKNGKYLYNASSSNNSSLKSKADMESWTITIASGKATINSVENSNRTTMRYNPNTNGNSPLFNCYANGQNDIALYTKTPKVEGTTDEPTQATTLDDYADIVLDGGKVLTIDDDKTFSDVTAGTHDVVDIEDNKTLTVNDMIIGTESTYENDNTTSNSTQVKIGNNGSLVVVGDLYLDVQLSNGAFDPNYWYMISAPFNVSVAEGVYTTNGTQVPASKYAVWTFDAELYATCGTAWRRHSGTMLAGRAYLIGFDDDVDLGNPSTIRLKWQKESNTMTVPGTLTTQATTDGGLGHNNWNALGNPTLRHISLTTNAPTHISVFDNANHNFNPEKTSYATGSFGFVVGTPLFIQQGTSEITLEDANGTLRAPARSGSAAEYSFCVKIKKQGVQRSDNRIYVQASEQALPTFEMGKDLASLNSSSNCSALLWTNAYGQRLAAQDAPLVNNQAIYDLGLYAPAAGTYSLSAAAIEGADLYVTYEGAIVWNLSLGDYEMDLVRGTTTGYGLLLVVQPNQMPTGVENGELLNGENGVQKILLNGQLYILRDGHLYDAVGKEMK